MQSINKNINTNDCWLFIDFWNEFYKFYMHHQSKKSKRELFAIVDIKKDIFYRTASKCSWLNFPNKLSANSLLFSKFFCNKKIIELIGIDDLSILTKEFSKIVNIGTAQWAEIIIKKMKDE